MIRCMSCGMQNEDGARFCAGCGHKIMPLPTGHDFTTGVMRYVPETETADVSPALPYLPAPEMPVQPAALPRTAGVPDAGNPQRNKNKVSTATLAIICAILVLTFLIVAGIVYLLGGVF